MTETLNKGQKNINTKNLEDEDENFSDKDSDLDLDHDAIQHLIGDIAIDTWRWWESLGWL
jgi:hypothetical protein